VGERLRGQPLSRSAGSSTAPCASRPSGSRSSTPAARLVSWRTRSRAASGLRGAVVVERAGDGFITRRRALARERVAEAGAAHLASLRPAGAIGVSWGRTMLELAAHCDLAGPPPRRSSSSTAHVPLRVPDARPRDRGAVRGDERRPPSGSCPPAIVGSPELRDALEEIPRWARRWPPRARLARRSSAWA